MSEGKMNPHILQKIKQNSETDDQIAKFLTELIIDEASHAGNWWWKESYKKSLQEYIKNWGTENEN